MTTEGQVAYDEETGISAHVEWDDHYYPDDSPRDWEPITRLCLFHGRYSFPNELDAEPQEPTKDELTEWEVIGIWPVFAYEHGAITIRIGSGGNPFTCPWDSGQLGFVAITKPDWEKHFSDEPYTEERGQEIAEAEVKEYDAHINGLYARVWIEKDGEMLDGQSGFLCPDHDLSYPTEDVLAEWKGHVKDDREGRKFQEARAAGSWMSLRQTVLAYEADRQREAVA